MSIGEPKMPTPEEIAKIKKERILSDAKLIQGGAEIEVDKEGNIKNLLPTENQHEAAQKKAKSEDFESNLPEQTLTPRQKLEKFQDRTHDSADRVQGKMFQISREIRKLITETFGRKATTDEIMFISSFMRGAPGGYFSDMDAEYENDIQQLNDHVFKTLVEKHCGIPASENSFDAYENFAKLHDAGLISLE